MNERTLILIIAIIYFIFPIDLIPGLPVDDLVVLGVAITLFLKNKRVKSN